MLKKGNKAAERKEERNSSRISITYPYLLKLELDGGLELLDLTDHVVSVGDHRREFTGFVQTGTQNTRNLTQRIYRSYIQIAMQNAISH